MLAQKKTVPKTKTKKRRRVTNPIDIQGENSNTHKTQERMDQKSESENAL